MKIIFFSSFHSLSELNAKTEGRSIRRTPLQESFTIFFFLIFFARFFPVNFYASASFAWKICTLKCIKTNPLKIGRNNFDFSNAKHNFCLIATLFFFTLVTAQLTFFLSSRQSIEQCSMWIKLCESFFLLVLCLLSIEIYAIICLYVYLGHTSIRTAEATIQVICACAWMDGDCVCACRYVKVYTAFCLSFTRMYCIWYMNVKVVRNSRCFIRKDCAFSGIGLLVTCADSDVSKRWILLSSIHDPYCGTSYGMYNVYAVW